MDRTGMQRAAKLLAKAMSTDSDDEALALTVRAYELLAKTITAVDLARGETEFGPRRRERRRMFDRRARPRPERAEPVAPRPKGAGAAPADRYRDPGEHKPPGGLDISI